MSKVEAVILNTKPFRPTDFNEKAMQAVLDESYLTCDVKKDGVRLNLCVSGRDPVVNVEWLSREGKRFPALIQYLQGDARWSKFYNPHIGEALFNDEGFMLDAELILLDAEGAERKCKDTSGTLRRKDKPVPMDRIRVYVFDIVPLDMIALGIEWMQMQCVRKGHVEYQVAKLKEYFPEIDWRVAESYDVFSMEALPERHEVDAEGNEIECERPLSLSELFTAVRERGEEGLVCKDPMGYYRRSKCSGWWKMVPSDNEDGKVVGLVWGTEGLANAGKVIGFEVLLESGHVVNACKISRALMDEFTAKVRAYVIENAYAFTVDPERSTELLYKDVVEVNGKHWNPYEGFTVRVKCMERYPDGSMRHPSFDEFRGISDPYIKE